MDVDKPFSYTRGNFMERQNSKNKKVEDSSNDTTLLGAHVDQEGQNQPAGENSTSE